MDKPKVIGRDMPPRKRARGVINNDKATASWAKSTKLTLKGGKGKAPVVATHA